MNALVPTPSVLRVLVVDDDPDLCSLLSEYLSANGFVVQTVGDGAAMRAVLADGLPDAIVMDLMLPGEDGLSLTRGIKAQWDIPVLMLSARGEEMDRVIGLEVGADDYLPKPFGPRELLAPLAGGAPACAPLTRAGGRTPVRRCIGCTSGRGAAVLWALPARHRWPPPAARRTRGGSDQCRVRAARGLCQPPCRVLSRDVLVDMLKGYDRDPFDRSVDSRVTRLRRKIEADPAAPQYIRTVRGEGYLFNPQGGGA